MINVKIQKENINNLVKYYGFIVSKKINLTYIGFCLLCFDIMQSMTSGKYNDSSYLYFTSSNIHDKD